MNTSMAKFRRGLPVVLVLLGAGLACDKRKDATEELARLQAETREATAALKPLSADVTRLSASRDALTAQIASLRSDADVLKAEKEGRGVHYVFSVSIRQVSYSLSLRKQLRDAVNEETFDMPVDRITYEHTAVGQDLFDSFRAGSAIFHGTLGSWRLKVEGKRIVTDG